MAENTPSPAPAQTDVQQPNDGAELAAAPTIPDVAESETASVYLVRGASGEYDGYRQWVICAFADAGRASAEASRLSTLQREWEAKYEAIEIPETDDDSDWYERREAIRTSAPANIDPSDRVDFDVWKVPFFRLPLTHDAKVTQALELFEDLVIEAHQKRHTPEYPTVVSNLQKARAALGDAYQEMFGFSEDVVDAAFAAGFTGSIELAQLIGSVSVPASAELVGDRAGAPAQKPSVTPSPEQET